MCLTEFRMTDIRPEITSLFTYRRETTLTDGSLIRNDIYEYPNFVGH